MSIEQILLGALAVITSYLAFQGRLLRKAKQANADLELKPQLEKTETARKEYEDANKKAEELAKEYSAHSGDPRDTEWKP